MNSRPRFLSATAMMLALPFAPAWAAPPPIRESVAICDPGQNQTTTPGSCATVINGVLSVSGGGGGGGGGQVTQGTTPWVSSMYGQNGSSIMSALNPFATTTNDTYSTGTIASGTASASTPAYTIPLGAGQATAAISLSGLTASGATLTLEASDNKGATYFPVRNIGTATVAGSTTFTTDQSITVSASGHTNLALFVTTAGSGNVSVTSNASSGAKEINLGGPGTALTNPLFANGYNYVWNGTAWQQMLGDTSGRSYVDPVGSGGLVLQQAGPTGGTLGLVISGGVADGNAPLTYSHPVAGVDAGGLKRTILTDTNGRQIITGPSTSAPTPGTASPIPTAPTPFRYQVAGTYGGTGTTTSTAGVVAAAVGPLYSERSYILRVAGTLASGDTLQWQGLLADGVTWGNIGSAISTLPVASTAYVSPAVPAGSAANLRLVKTGTGSDTIFASAD